MSKRFIFPQQSGDRKKPRLDVSVSGHNFPLSQNAGSNNVADGFDDNDDELLLQASQACEQACNASVFPTYSQFKPQKLTSTQLEPLPSPSSSQTTFSFKTPTFGQSNSISTLLKDKCGRISSPLPGIVTKVGITEVIDLTDNYFIDKVLDVQDTDYMYKQLLQFKEENEKLKAENGKLLEKCVTKEGEASILRTQLKACQLAVDNARLQKIKAHEQTLAQWSEKYCAANKQLFDTKTQLDSKNLEIINMKERCKILESNTIKLTQITLAGNEVSRANTTIGSNSLMVTQAERLKTASITVQTDNYPQFLKLSKPCRLDKANVTQILPLVMDSATDHQHSILDYNEKLKRPTDFSPNKSRILSSFHRPSSSTDYSTSKSKVKLTLSAIYEDLTVIAACNNEVEKAEKHYLKVFDATRTALEDVQCELEMVSRRMTSAFQKDMDRRYIEASMVYVVVEDRDLISGKALFKEEQSILARRMAAVLHTLLKEPKALQLFNRSLRSPAQSPGKDRLQEFINLITRICTLLDNNCCGLLYSGLLLSVVSLVEVLARGGWAGRLGGGVRRVAACRGALAVPCRVLRALAAARDLDAHAMCSGTAGNLKFDYEQGVLLFKKDSCLLQVFLRQVESALECMERQGLVLQLVDTTRHLLEVYTHIESSRRPEQNSKCNCGNLLVQVVVHALKICSTMLDGGAAGADGGRPESCTQLLAVCRSGLHALHERAAHDPDFMGQLDYDEGNLIHFCEQLCRYPHNKFYDTMLSEMIQSFQAGEEAGAAFHQHAWLRSFETFSLAD